MTTSGYFVGGGKYFLNMNLNLDFDSCGHVATPIGAISVYVKNDSIVYVHMGQPVAPDYGNSPIVGIALRQITEYVSGERRDFDLPLTTGGTDFQRAVWEQIKLIPYGQTVSYANIAQALGKPLASRAVGGAVGSNPVALLIPCHRVMGASGKITGYSGGDGIPTKRWLLALEGIASAD